ncbi:MAG: hypothetical protein NPIRA02_16190 [Nitrospirales bacterium]|nr:MAG: hypothetical protein NPIRA02_16190 [Nitrospirales bacterium]
MIQDFEYSIPAMTIEWSTVAMPEIQLLEGTYPTGRGVVVGCRNLHPAPHIKKSKFRDVLIIGGPIVNDKINADTLAEWLISGQEIDAVLPNINGQFLVVIADKSKREVYVINDRFNGVSLFWANVDGYFVAATGYIDLIKCLRNRFGACLRTEPMFEFIWLQRLLGDKTYDSQSSYLLPATKLAIGQKGVIARHYWRPDFSKKSRTTVEAGEEFTSLLVQAIRSRTSDCSQKKYGLFLSGGHDSRTLLAAFEKPPECFTVAFSDNYEVQCARLAAHAVNAMHRYVSLDDSHFMKYIDEASYLCGGMYATDHALFLGMAADIIPNADVLFHGHGFDYFFQGIYLTAHPIFLLGSPTFFRRLSPIDGNISELYLKTIPFRLKQVPLLDFLKPAWKNRMWEMLRESVTQVLRSGDDVCQTNYDRWEYLLIHALGRHYSRPNITSKGVYAEERTVSFDNRLFEFYASLIPKHRLYAQPMRYAMKKLASDLAGIPTGNWGIAAGASPIYKTSYLIGRKVMRHLTGKMHLQAPSAKDRTWPDRDIYLRTHKDYMALARQAIWSEELEVALDYIDWPSLRHAFEVWFAQPAGGGGLAVTLITLHRFLHQIR